MPRAGGRATGIQFESFLRFALFGWEDSQHTCTYSYSCLSCATFSPHVKIGKSPDFPILTLAIDSLKYHAFGFNFIFIEAAPPTPKPKNAPFTSKDADISISATSKSPIKASEIASNVSCISTRAFVIPAINLLDGTGTGVGATATIFLGRKKPFLPWRNSESLELKLAGLDATLAVGLAAALAAGLAAALAAGLATGLTARFAAGFTAGFAAALATGLAAGFPKDLAACLAIGFEATFTTDFVTTGPPIKLKIFQMYST